MVLLQKTESYNAELTKYRLEKDEKRFFEKRFSVFWWKILDLKALLPIFIQGALGLTLSKKWNDFLTAEPNSICL